MRTLGIWVAILCLEGCGMSRVGDVTPPLLLKTEISEDGREVALSFDEPLNGAETAIDHRGSAPPLVEGGVVKVPLPPGLKPGTGHVWSAEVTDEGKNTTSVAGKFYAPNPHPAGLRLNEVRVAGSGVHTDMVELRVETAGSLGGWTIEAWSGPETRQRTVLTDGEVQPGDFVVIRYRPPGEATDAAPGSREFWQAEAKGLGATKGLILLRRRPDGPPEDGLLYSKKAGEAQAIAQAAGWDGSERDPSGCTATRTWCRSEGTDPSWVVVATGGSTPGAANKLTPWEGPTSSRGATSKTKGGTGDRRRKRSDRGWRSRPGSTTKPGGPGARPGSGEPRRRS